MSEIIERRAAKRQRRNFAYGLAALAVLLIAVGTVSAHLRRLRAREVVGRSVPDRPAVGPTVVRGFARPGPPLGAAELFSGRLPRRPADADPSEEDLGVTFSPEPEAEAGVPDNRLVEGGLPALDKRNFWRFAYQAGDPSSGYFRRRIDRRWEEVGRDGVILMGVWEEFGRTPDYVELHDPKRNYKTRLGTGKAWMAAG